MLMANSPVRGTAVSGRVDFASAGSDHAVDRVSSATLLVRMPVPSSLHFEDSIVVITIGKVSSALAKASWAEYRLQCTSRSKLVLWFSG